MTFTEVVFEVGDARHPLCRLTRTPTDAYAVYRIQDTGQVSRRFRTQVTFHGSDEACEELVKELRAQRPDDLMEVLFQGAGMVLLQIETLVPDAAAARGFPAMAVILERFGVDTLLEPFLVADGRIRARLVVPRHLDTQDALRSLQEIQRVAGFTDFRVLRVGSVEAALHLDMVRRILPPEQEELLGLAASLGYYSTPKGATLEAIAGSVGLSISPVHKRLKAAEESLVQLHVVPHEREAPRRRARRDVAQIVPSGPWEATVRVRAPSLGPSAAIAATPGARALLQVLSEDLGSRTATALFVIVAPEPDQSRLMQEIERHPDVTAVQAISRDHDHASARLVVRDGGAFGLAWWRDVWGSDAYLRPMLFEGHDVTVRFVLLRPHTHERFDSRMAEVAKRGEWDGHELIAVRAVRRARSAPTPPEPLTPRQLEVLRIAHALGYYQTPRKCTLEQVAATLGVSANAIHKNLVLAESKLIAAYLVAGL